MKTTRLRKALSILLSLALVVGFLPVYTIHFAPRAMASQSGSCGSGADFSIDVYSDRTVLTVSGSNGTGGRMDDYTLASGVSTAPYSEFASQVTEVQIEHGVSHIGAYAFYGFTNLRSVTIGGRPLYVSVKSIGASAFENCVRLSSVSYQYNGNSTSSLGVFSLKTIGDKAFKGCSSLSYLKFPNDLTFVGDYAFQNCTALTGFDASDTKLAVIGAGAFQNCTDLSSFEPSACLVGIGASAFSGCESLENVTLPNPDTSLCDFSDLDTPVMEKCYAAMAIIGDSAFAGCTNLEITVSSFFTNLGVDAFDGVVSLYYAGSAAGEPWGAEALYRYFEGDLAFANAAHYEVVHCKLAATGTVSIPSVVTAIAAGAFENCTQITQINIPPYVETIGSRAFASCVSLNTVNYSASNVADFTESSEVFYRAGETPAPNALFPSVIPAGVTVNFGSTVQRVPAYLFADANVSKVYFSGNTASIGDHAFDGCDGLTYIELPVSLTSVGDGAFNGCVGLQTAGTTDGYNIKFPWTDEIPGGVFTGMTQLTSVSIPAACTVIDAHAFEDCVGLTSITIPESVTEIGARTFAGCTGLTSITVRAADLADFSDSDNVFYDAGSAGTGIAVRFESTVGRIPANMFLGDEFGHTANVKTVVICDGVPSIGDGAFATCANLTDVTIPASVQSMGSLAFYGCFSLNTVSIPCNVGYAAFAECFSLQTVDIAEGAVNIGEMAFAYDVNLESVTIPASMTEIGEGAFTLHIEADVVASLQQACAAAVANGETHIEGIPLDVIQAVIANPNTSLTDASYPGTIEDWEDVVVGSGNEDLIAALQVHNHTYTSVTTPATCTQEGSITYTCECGYTYTEAIPKIDHTDEDNDGVCDVCGRLTVTSGTDGSISWNYDYDTETLTLSGSGSMRTYGNNGHLTNAPWSPFYNMMKHVVIEDGVTWIGACAFYGCTAIEDVSIPDSVTGMGYNAFQDCYGLQSIALSEYITSIGNGAFKNCRGLTEIYYNASVTGSYSTGSDLFLNAGTAGSGITLTIGSAVTKVPGNLFYTKDAYSSSQRPNVTTLIIEEGCTEIGSQAFYNCENLTTVYLPKTLQTVGQKAFYNCTPIADTYYAGTQEDWQSITINTGNDELYVLLNGVVVHYHIHSYVYTVTTPATCTEEGLGTYTCECGDTYTEPIPKVAHSDANDDGLCDVCGRLAVTSGMLWEDRVTWNFDEDTKTLTIQPIEAYQNVFWGIADFEPDTVPWRHCAPLIESIVLGENIIQIGSYAFAGCTALVDVTIPSGHFSTKIGDYAFKGSGLTTITIPSTVTSIGAYAFEDSALTTITIPNSVTSIGTGAFYHCADLQSATLPSNSSYTEISSRLFGSCSSLTGITIPSTVTKIGDYAFENSALTTITIPDSVTAIGPSAFEGNTQLSEVSIPLAVLSVGDAAFSGCVNLTTVHYPGVQEDWNKIVIGDNNEPLLNATLDLHIHTDADYDAHCDGCGLDLCDIHVGETKTVSIAAAGTTLLRFVPTISASYTLTSLADTDNCDPFVYLYDANQNMIAYSDDISSSDLNFGLTVDLFMGQIYYFGCALSDDASSGSYQVALSQGAVLEPLVRAPGRNVIIDPTLHLIYGIRPHTTDLSTYFTAADGYTYTCTGMVRDGVYSTGTRVNVYSGSTLVTYYDLVMVGDVDGDGWYDGNDAYLVRLIVNGMISPDALTQIQYYACDANHDDEVDAADAELLELAGVLLTDVDPSKIPGELEEDSVYLEYCSLIDQTVELVKPAEEAVQEPVEEPAPSFLAKVLSFLRSVFIYVFNLIFVKVF